MALNISAPSISFKLVDGTNISIDDTSKMTAEDLISEINFAAVKIDNDWQMEGKALDDEEQ
eukprot:CAMPEP_0172586116 /NCGR_PEP_ID=MMETSP1068-20121228/5501_1 /TAXON_ID=35684 /ORGANISM="Pseudopedinella elastica, Strain CCMP716" /LENGTH=60 /DNA_ID=CAMNT_0013380813 /DNA_START=234 /DNA_END=416 /DNA_ORIENTATION=-